MKSKIVTPNITQINLYFESTDEIYHRCMWARINLDNDNYSLMVESDCGSYSYRWKPTDCESFLELMCRINESYLLDKIANKNIFDCDETIKTFLERYKNDVCLSEELLEKIKQSNAFSLQEYINENIFKDINIYECACYKYPYGAITFCELFKDYVRPLIKEYLEEQHGK